MQVHDFTSGQENPWLKVSTTKAVNNSLLHLLMLNYNSSQSRQLIQFTAQFFIDFFIRAVH
jgi:hypothetical protein